MIWHTNEKNATCIYLKLYMRMQPPFSSGGGLFAFSIVAIKESKILAEVMEVRFSQIAVCFFYLQTFSSCFAEVSTKGQFHCCASSDPSCVDTCL